MNLRKSEVNLSALFFKLENSNVKCDCYETASNVLEALELWALEFSFLDNAAGKPYSEEPGIHPVLSSRDENQGKMMSQIVIYDVTPWRGVILTVTSRH